MGRLFVLVPFGFFRPRNTNLNYRPGNTIIPPLIKRYPAAGHLCYLGGAFMILRRVNDLPLAGTRKRTCDLKKKLLQPGQKRVGSIAFFESVKSFHPEKNPSEREDMVCSLWIQKKAVRILLLTAFLK